MQRIDPHDSMVAELKKIKKIENRSKFFRYIKDKNYLAALRLATDACHPHDMQQLQVVQTLLRYRIVLNMKLDNNEMTANFDNALFNSNVDLYKLLMDDFSLPTVSDTAEGNVDLNYGSLKLTIGPNVEATATLDIFADPQIKMHLKQEEYYRLFSTYFNVRKGSRGNSDAENKKHDIEKIKFIITALKYLIELEQTRTNKEITNLLSEDQKKEMDRIILNNTRLMLTNICVVIYGLSYPLREKYGKSFAPAPFTWVTFEQLCGCIKYGVDYKTVEIVPIDAVSADAANTRKNFSKEITATKNIVSESLSDIARFDLPVLEAFFKEILLQELKNTNNPIEVRKLPTIKALTSYVRDRITLVNLMNLVSYTDNENKSIKNYVGVTFFDLSRESEAHKRRFRLDTVMGKHAALRRLQKIGELITGKNFTSGELLDTVDWQAFITIRDTIVHQDEKDNQHKVAMLLADNPRLQSIFTHDFVELDILLTQLLIKRAASFKRFDKDSNEVQWQSILKVSNEKYEPIKAVPVAAQDSIRRVSIERQHSFLENMRSNSAPEELIKLAEEVFSGLSKIPPKQKAGEILRYITPNKLNRDLNKEMKQIWDEALSHGALNRDERMEKKKQGQDAKVDRDQERETKFQGLAAIRILARDFKGDVNEAFLLNPTKRLECALDHINNINLFLQATNYFKPSVVFKSINEWEDHHKKHNTPNFMALCLNNHELKDALEYNISQTLQHLDRISELDCAKDSKFLKLNAELLRVVRNHLEHGNLIIDDLAYRHDKDLSPEHRKIEAMQTIVSCLIYELLPALEELRNQATFKPSKP